VGHKEQICEKQICGERLKNNPYGRAVKKQSLWLALGG